MFRIPIATKFVAGAGAGLLLLGATTTAVLAANTSPTPASKATATKPAKADHRDRKTALTAYLEASASVLGMSLTDLKAALKSGKSMSDLATAKGFNKETFSKAVASAATPLLEADVKSGKLTAREAAKVEKRLAAGRLPLWDGHHHQHHKPAAPKH